MISLGQELARLKICAYRDKKREDRAADPITVMYNPQSIDLGFQAQYKSNTAVNKYGVSLDFTGYMPGGLSLELIFDATLPGNSAPVEGQVSKLRSMCFGEEKDGSAHEPYYLSIQWGEMQWGGHKEFQGRTRSLSIRYTMFDHKGKPLRASASLALSADERPFKASEDAARKGLLSRVKGKATLALVSKLKGAASLAAYEAIQTGSRLVSESDYLRVAHLNDLDSLGSIRPGDVLKLLDNKGDHHG
jgi:hypothetical protein